MKHFLAASIAALVATFGITSLVNAEVRIGLAAPLTGPQGWMGGVNEEGAEIAVADLNARGGVLGEPIELIKADDYCDCEQAVAAANKLVAAGVVAPVAPPRSIRPAACRAKPNRGHDARHQRYVPGALRDRDAVVEGQPHR